MRNRRKTIESLRRLAERPGTKAEGEVAQAMLEKMLGRVPAIKAFDATEFPTGTAVFYNCWAYPENDPCVIVGKAPKVIQGRTWMRLKFANHLKQPRWVPVTGPGGCYISKTPLSPQDAEYLYHDFRVALDDATRYP